LEEILEIWTMGVINVVVLGCVLRATTKKGRPCTPRENPGYAYESSWVRNTQMK